MPAASSIEKQKKLSWNVLDYVKEVLTIIKKSKLKPEKTKTFTEMMKRLNQYFGTENDTQTFILCYAIKKHYKKKFSRPPQTTVKAFAKYVDVDVLEMSSKMKKDFDYLNKNTLINYRSVNNFWITERVIKSVLDNIPIPQQINSLNKNSFLSTVSAEFESEKYSYITTEVLVKKLIALEKNVKNIFFVKKCKKKISDHLERFSFYEICANYVSEESSTNLREMCLALYGLNNVDIIEKFRTKEHFLIRENLVDIQDTDSIIDASISLSEKGMEFLDKKNRWIQKPVQNNESKLYIETNYQEIKSKKLFYDTVTLNSLDEILTALNPSRFPQIQQNWNRTNVTTSYITLLYGPPGTGKTEFYRQAAKKTHRNIMEADVSRLKNSYVGETEKNLHQMFRDYENYLDKGEMPILVLNECDSLICKRSDMPLSNTTVADNSWINVLLEEFENFKGLMFLTTNMVSNIDKAFDRRIYQKIHIQIPSKETRKKIWNYKLKNIDLLSSEQIKFLADSFNFSGGQIDNIIKKIVEHEVYESKPSFDDIVNWCKTETINEEEGKLIGFLR